MSYLSEFLGGLPGMFIHQIKIILHSLVQFSCNFTRFRLLQPFLGQYQHVGYQNACTWPKRFNRDTFTHFHTLLHTISRNFTQFHAISAISAIFRPISTWWVPKSMYSRCMLSIKKHVLELTNSMVILAEALGLQKGSKAPKKRPKASKGGQWPPSSPLLCQNILVNLYTDLLADLLTIVIHVNL